MDDLINKHENFSKIEFWAATTLFVLAILGVITPAVESEFNNVWAPNRQMFEQAGVRFGYFRHYFFPQLIQYTVLYAAFLLVNFNLAPGLMRRRTLRLNTLNMLLIFLGMGLIFGITDTYLKNYLFRQFPTADETYEYIFQSGYLYASWLTLLFGIYTAIKYGGLYLLDHAEAIQNRYRFLTPAVLTGIVFWLLGLLFLAAAGAEKPLFVIWGVLVPLTAVVYLYSFYYLIPNVLSKRSPFRRYIVTWALVLFAAAFPVFLVTGILTGREETAIGVAAFNFWFQLLITSPATWVLFKRHMRGNEELYVLKRELGQSTASFDFLRSQINPHFLFNALNTIYGTAIQEKAERTSEGIEKLGDMMRFMLQENMQEKIPLTREIEYLNNYIDLQKLRTDANPCVSIQAEVEPPAADVQISPMLLIPFVENAFKHGISFREPSPVNITLEVRDDVLYFDVYNRKHGRHENDPEKDKSGIGLINVRQRLQLLYPNRHDLFIRETGKEFFVHLALQLT